METDDAPDGALHEMINDHFAIVSIDMHRQRADVHHNNAKSPAEIRSGQ